MEATPTIRRVRSFLALLRDGESPSDMELAGALDRLAVAYHDAPAGQAADDERDAPETDFMESYAALGKRFPEFGLYAVADPTEPLNDEPMVGDAIDDLADIVRELDEVLWRFDILERDEIRPRHTLS